MVVSERNLRAGNRTTWRPLAPECEISQFHLLRRDEFNSQFVPSPKSHGSVQFRSSTHSEPIIYGQGNEVIVTMRMAKKVSEERAAALVKYFFNKGSLKMLFQKVWRYLCFCSQGAQFALHTSSQV